MNKQDMKRLWQGFWQIADPKIWIASTIPMAVGATLAFTRTGQFSWKWFLLGAMAIYLIEIGKNAINEYVDYRSGVDRFVAADKRTPFSGGKKTIIDGKLTLKENLIIGILTISAGCLVGVLAVLLREFNILWIGLAGVFFALFYSLPPFKFSYRGLGETVVGITFGPLITSGTYLLQTHVIDLSVLLISLPLGFLIANILWINQYPDFEADQQGNKRNSLVRLGKEKGVIVYAMLFMAAYLSIIFFAFYSSNYFMFLPLVSIPLARRASVVCRQYYDDILRLIEANAKTVLIYQVTGITIVIALFIDQFCG